MYVLKTDRLLDHALLRSTQTTWHYEPARLYFLYYKNIAAKVFSENRTAKRSFGHN